jgi:pimeloyl-ACP methyl ester carboxylesterase
MERVLVGGVEVEYRLIGPGSTDTPTIVFLHEGLGSASLWRDFPDRVCRATGWGGLVWSRWGYGGSDPRPLPWPHDYLEHMGRERVPALLEVLGIGDHLLWGHSDGASIALVNAGVAPAAGLRGVMSVACHVYAGVAKTVEPMREVGERFASGELRARLARHHEDVDGAFHGWFDTWTDPAFATWSIEHLLGGIEVPVVVAQGDADEYDTLEQVERTVAAIRPGLATPLVIPECGHQPHLEHPEVMVEATKAFVDRIAE